MAGCRTTSSSGATPCWADPGRSVEFASVLSLPLRYERLRQQLSVEGSRTARAEFGWRGIAKRTASVVERIRDEHSRRQLPDQGPVSPAGDA